MREKTQLWLKQWKGKLPLPALAVLAVGCLLLLLPTGVTIEPEQVANVEEDFVLEQFERRLEQAIACIHGAGETRVVLSLNSGSRQILAQDRQQDSSGSSLETVTVGGSAERAVVPIQTVAPEFRGALVVCQGAENAQVRLEVTKAVCVLTGLGTDCVCVTVGKS